MYGIHIAFTAKENIGHYSLFRNWMFALQRFSGIVTFVFIFMHLWQTTIQNTSLVKAVDFELMHKTLENQFGLSYISFVFYVLFSISQMVYGHSL